MLQWTDNQDPKGLKLGLGRLWLLVGLIAFLGVLALAGCGEETTGPTPPPPPPQVGAPALDIIAGNNQRGDVGTRLATELHARVRRDSATVKVPVPDMIVEWRVLTEGGGAPFLSVTQTTAEGDVRNFWDLGNVAGAHQMEVRAILNGQPVSVVVFGATADPGPPVSMSIDLPTEVNGWTGTKVALPNAEVVDAFGNVDTVPATVSPAGAVAVSGDTATIGEGTGQLIFTVGTLADTTYTAGWFDLRTLVWSADPFWCRNRSDGNVDSLVVNLAAPQVVEYIEASFGQRKVHVWYAWTGTYTQYFATGQVITRDIEPVGGMGTLVDTGYLEAWQRLSGDLDYIHPAQGDGALVSTSPRVYSGGDWTCSQLGYVGQNDTPVLRGN